jgi:hypothetical protein
MRQLDLFDPPPYRVNKLDLKGHAMNVNDIFPSRYIKSSELKGRSVTAVIERWEIEKVGDDRKLVLYFQGKEKGMIVNKTNADRISHMYGPDTDDWIGREIILYSEVTNFQGRAMDGLRVRAPEPRQPAHRNNVRPAPPRPRSGGNFVVDPPDDDIPPWEPDR